MFIDCILGHLTYPPKKKTKFPIDFCSWLYVRARDTFSYFSLKPGPKRLKLEEGKAQWPAYRYELSNWSLVNLLLFSSSPIHSPVQQLPADPEHQENRWGHLPLWGQDPSAGGDQLQGHSGHCEWWENPFFLPSSLLQPWSPESFSLTSPLVYKICPILTHSSTSAESPPQLGLDFFLLSLLLIYLPFGSPSSKRTFSVVLECPSLSCTTRNFPHT